MLLDKNLKRAWKTEIKTSGLTILAKEAECDHRTITKAIDSGECRKDTYDKVNAAIIKLRSARASDPIVKQLIAG